MISFVGRRIRWMVIGAVGRELGRRLGGRHVDRARQDLADRLPDRAIVVIDALPGDVLRTAGTARVASRTAIRSARFSRTVVRAPSTARRHLSQLGEEWNSAVAVEDRSFRAQLIEYTRGRTAADDVRLGGRTSWEDEPLPPVAPPVVRGRRRPAGPARRLVARVQRTYRPSRRPWQ